MNEQEMLQKAYQQQGKSMHKMTRSDEVASQRIQQNPEYTDIKEDLLKQLGI